VEHLVRERIYPPARSPIPRPRVSPLVFIVSIMVGGFAVAILGVRAVAQSIPTTPAPNPFPAYADVYPGQPMSAVETRGFSCQYSYDLYHRPSDVHRPTEASCVFTPASGMFSGSGESHG